MYRVSCRSVHCQAVDREVDRLSTCFVGMSVKLFIGRAMPNCALRCPFTTFVEDGWRGIVLLSLLLSSLSFAFQLLIPLGSVCIIYTYLCPSLAHSLPHIIRMTIPEVIRLQYRPVPACSELSPRTISLIKVDVDLIAFNS
jgi:hypothetical protein